MAKNGKIYFDLNFEKSVIKEYIKKNLSEEEITDENIDIMFQSIIRKITEEALPNLKDLYINPDYKYIQMRIVGHKEEPNENGVDITINEDDTEEITLTSK